MTPRLKHAARRHAPTTMSVSCSSSQSLLVCTMATLNGKLTVNLQEVKGLLKGGKSFSGPAALQVLVNGVSTVGAPQAISNGNAAWTAAVPLEVVGAPLGAVAQFVLLDTSSGANEPLGTVSMALPDNAAAAGVFDAMWQDIVGPDGKSRAGQLNFGMEWATKRSSSRSSSRESRAPCLLRCKTAKSLCDVAFSARDAKYASDH